MMSHKRQSGISLIIIAILLVVIGTAVGTMVMRKDREAEWNPKTGSATDISRVKDALVAFQRANHRLPCVAPRNALPNTASYGEELTNCAGGAAASGGTIRINLGTEYLRIGAVPHKTLGLSESSSEDQWKNRMTYAVTESLTDVFQFSNHSGAITVNDEGTGNVISDAAFVVVSHGKDGKGAYGGKTGSIGKTCLITAGKDQANCNDSDAVFVSANMESASGTNFFDDMLAWAAVDSTAQSSNMPCMVATTGDATWGTGCSSNGYANMANGGSQNANNTNTSTHVGDVTLGCDNGTLTYTGGTCFRHCIASTQAWDGTCAGNVPLVNHSTTSGSVANTNSGYTGSATFACVDGNLTIDAHSCAPVVTGCTAQPVSWSGTCAGNLGSTLNEGDSTPVTNTNPGFTGGVTVTCTGGNLIQSGASCTPDAGSSCTAQTVTWGGINCQADVGALADGASAPVTNTTPNYTGSGTVTCSSGSLTQGSMICNPRAPDCYELYSIAENPCGSFHYDNGTTEEDFSPCDAGIGTPPAGWSFCGADDPCLDNGYGSNCLISGSDYGNGCIGTDIFGNGTVCCAGCTPPAADCAPASKSWTVGGHNCTAMTDATVADGDLATATDSIGFRGTPTGEAQFLCTDGTLAALPEPGATCDVGGSCNPGECEVYDSACGWMCRQDGEIWIENSATPSCWKYRCDSGVATQLTLHHMCSNMCMKN